MSSIRTSAAPKPVSVLSLGAGGCQLWVAYESPSKRRKRTETNRSGKRGFWNLVFFERFRFTLLRTKALTDSHSPRPRQVAERMEGVIAKWVIKRELE